jgi:integration host factor subunit beta
MTKSELIEKLACKQNHLPYGDVEVSVKALLEQMSEALACGGRIEIRGFGSFSVRTQSPRTGRNPRTGEAVSVPAKLTPHFKPGKGLRERVNGFGNKK